MLRGPVSPTSSNVASAPRDIPKSVTHFGLNSIALAIVLATMYGLRAKVLRMPDSVVAWCAAHHMPGALTAFSESLRNPDPVLILCASVAIPVVALDVLVLKVHRRESTGLDWDGEFTPSLERVILKVAGLLLTLAPFAFGYWIFPEYNGSFYNPYYNLLLRFWPGLTASAILYITIVDGHMREPRDAYWQLGRLLLGKWRDLDAGRVWNHYLGWLVKAFFFPLMFVWLNNSTHNVVNFDLSFASWSNLRAYDFLYDFIFFIDLLFTTVGYALCFRAVDTHLRSAEPSFFGWGVALFCYEPFFSMLFEKQYVAYHGEGFGNWLGAYEHLRWAWAIGILLLITIYVLATVAFGVRFSNLTHRGILTNGPYRFTKHPAYVSKNMSWWMMSVPFIPNEGWALAIKHCVLLGALNTIYYLRAKTEERHLSRDPIYVQYALWMNEHGTLRFLNRIPGLRHLFVYKPPTGVPFLAPITGYNPFAAPEADEVPEGTKPAPAASEEAKSEPAAV